jgi:hypothetical protein
LPKGIRSQRNARNFATYASVRGIGGAKRLPWEEGRSDRGKVKDRSCRPVRGVFTRLQSKTPLLRASPGSPPSYFGFLLCHSVKSRFRASVPRVRSPLRPLCGHLPLRGRQEFQGSRLSGRQGRRGMCQVSYKWGGVVYFSPKSGMIKE